MTSESLQTLRDSGGAGNSRPRASFRVDVRRCQGGREEGHVKELQWTNPHVWLQVVIDENGKKTEWSLEGGSPNTLSRQGWRATTFKAGDVVTVRFNPMKDGSAAGLFIGAKFDADGKTIGRVAVALISRSRRRRWTRCSPCPRRSDRPARTRPASVRSRRAAAGSGPIAGTPSRALSMWGRARR